MDITLNVMHELDDISDYTSLNSIKLYNIDILSHYNVLYMKGIIYIHHILNKQVNYNFIISN